MYKIQQGMRTKFFIFFFKMYMYHELRILILMT